MDLRDPGRDYELYKYTCQELQRLMAEIQDLKSRGGKEVVSRGPGSRGPGFCVSAAVIALPGPFLSWVCPGHGRVFGAWGSGTWL